jgi:hypothetical protein
MLSENDGLRVEHRYWSASRARRADHGSVCGNDREAGNVFYTPASDELAL